MDSPPQFYKLLSFFNGYFRRKNGFVFQNAIVIRLFDRVEKTVVIMRRFLVRTRSLNFGGEQADIAKSSRFVVLFVSDGEVNLYILVTLLGGNLTGKHKVIVVAEEAVGLEEQFVVFFVHTVDFHFRRFLERFDKLV